MINGIDFDKIYFPKSRSYFNEVVSSYSIGNYRSSVVMLYSLVVSDLLFKLQELSDRYNDQKAKTLLEDIEKVRLSGEVRSKSQWEWDLIEKISKETELLDSEVYIDIKHLYEYRNLSAHPVLNAEYELYNPSQEISIAYIKSMYNGVLIKPPIFIKKIFDLFIEDISSKKEIYKGENKELKRYLANKYFDRMSITMLKSLFKSLWKITYNLQNSECSENRVINNKALMILYQYKQQELFKFIKEENWFSDICMEDRCVYRLSIFLSKFPEVYPILDKNIKLIINNENEKDKSIKLLSWFIIQDKKEHLENLQTEGYAKNFGQSLSRYCFRKYKEDGLADFLLDYFIFCFTKSLSYDDANIRYDSLIRPFLNKMNYDHFTNLIKGVNDNDQLYGRYQNRQANSEIYSFAKDKLGSKFDYSKFDKFEFNENIIETVNIRSGEGTIESIEYNDEFYE